MILFLHLFVRSWLKHDISRMLLIIELVYWNSMWKVIRKSFVIKRGVRGVGKVYGLGLVGWVSTSSGSFCNEGAVKAGIASPPPLSTLLPRLASGYFTCTRHHQSVTWTTEILAVLEILHFQSPLWKLSKASFKMKNMTILLNFKKQYNFRSNANDGSDDEDD